jgi:hypothetical protein
VLNRHARALTPKGAASDFPSVHFVLIASLSKSQKSVGISWYLSGLSPGKRSENCSCFFDFPDIYRPDPYGGKMCF